MPYEVIITAPAIEEIKQAKQEYPGDFEHLPEAIKQISRNPRPEIPFSPDEPDRYHYMLGHFRVYYLVDDTNERVIIDAVDYYYHSW